MSYLTLEENRLGQEHYEMGNVWRPTTYEFPARERLHQGSDGDEPGAAAGAVSKPAGKRAKAARGASKNTVAVA